MIILINGTYGIGKTTTAKCLFEIFSDSFFSGGDFALYDPDDFILSEIDMNQFNSFFKIYGWECTANPAYLEIAQKNIKKLIADHIAVIVPMTLAHENGKKYIIDYFATIGEPLKHFILEADNFTTTQRIVFQKERDKKLSLKWIDTNLKFLKDNYPDAIRINTEQKAPRKIAKEIAREIDLYGLF